MEPKDLKNSGEELNVTPENKGGADAPIEKKEKIVSGEDLPEKEPVVEEVVEEAVIESEVSKDEEAVVAVEATEPEEEVVAADKEPVAEVAEAVSEEVTDESSEVETESDDEEADAEEEDTDDNDDESEEGEEDDDNSEDGDEDKQPKKETVDYSSMTEVELINALRALVENAGEDDLKDDVDRIKIQFYKKYRATVEAEKKKYIEDGGDEAAFVSENQPYEDDLKNLLNDYRNARHELLKSQESEKEENLRRKYEIIEEIKGLVNRDESINKTFQEFRDLQQEWRDIGLVPQSKLKDLWENYHHHVENFYDYIKINKELRDLDLKKNLETKIELCEKAEELLVEPSVIKAFNILQKYHEQWREIGPVPRDKKEELWERFKAATSQINKKHQEYFESRKLDQKKNLEAKTVLCEKAEEIANLDIDSNKDWEVRSKELIELQKVWRTIGFAPKKDNNRIYERFRSACDKFFDRKRDFYSQNKELQMNNLQMKTDLCVQAESLKDSTDWKKTTDEFIHIQKKWKEIGPVPRKHSDIIWKRFRAACDFFFDRKSEHFSHIDDEHLENMKLKQELIEEVKAYVLTKDDKADLTQMKEFQRRWSEIGHVPFKEKDKLQNEFRDAINIHFDNLKIDNQKRDLLKFRNKMSNMTSSSRGHNKMRFERDKYINKLKQLESDLALLNNNIGFFANTKNAEAMIEDVNRKIEQTHQKIKLLKEKIQIIDAMDEEE